MNLKNKWNPNVVLAFVAAVADFNISTNNRQKRFVHRFLCLFTMCSPFSEVGRGIVECWGRQEASYWGTWLAEEGSGGSSSLTEWPGRQTKGIQEQTEGAGTTCKFISVVPKTERGLTNAPPRPFSCPTMWWIVMCPSYCAKGKRRNLILQVDDDDDDDDDDELGDEEEGDWNGQRFSRENYLLCAM